MAWDQQTRATPQKEFQLPTGQGAGICERTKADKILGTTSFPTPKHGHNEWEERKRGLRPNFLRAPETVLSKPSPSADETSSPQNLRVRASSPLLGREYQHQARPRSARKLAKKMQQADSSPTLYSHFNPRDSTIDPIVQLESATKVSDSREKDAAETQSKTGQSIKPKEPKNPMKEPKRKIRPPRIDLSLLFPKPRPTTAPLLSPQRMTKSPSQASLSPRSPPPNANRFDERRLATTQFARPTAHRPSDHAPSESSDKENNGWPGTPLERTVRTSEFDLALDKYDELQRRHSRSTDRTIVRKGSHSSAGGSKTAGGGSKDRYLSPNPPPSHFSNRVSRSAGTWSGERPGRSGSDNRPISKKSSKSTLQTSDLYASSVLCLSSSEDEEDDDQLKAKRRPRDSMATYDDFEPEICTASAAQATKAPELKRVDRSTLTDTRPHYSTQPTIRHPSMSSTGKSSHTTPTSHSRQSSGAPTTTGQSDNPFHQGNQLLSPREIRRRSRVMAVTRQEEHLLEAMRQRKGKVSPSLFREPRPSGPDSEQQTMQSAPSRESVYSSDKSFLRLSSGPLQPRTAQSATNSDNGPSSQGTNSDTEQKTIHSTASPRVSLVYSESLPSPATSGASQPITPTLPLHRFSPQPSNKLAPPHPPPPVPQDQRRHSRRRTDSSEAIVLDEAVEESQEPEELPVWALGLDNGGAVTAVH